MDTAKKIIDEYLNFSGVRSSDEIKALMQRASVVRNTKSIKTTNEEAYQIAHICSQLSRAFIAALKTQGRKLDLEINPAPLYIFKDQQLGKFVDTGNVPGGGRQDQYWNKHKPKIQFEPKNVSVRKGSPLPAAIDLNSERSISSYFAIRAVEYGQWLTQQDRVNYLAGCGLAIYDLQKVLGYSPQQMGLYGFLSVAFGARGKGKALGHFEPTTYAINLTRFVRPEATVYRTTEFDRSQLLFKSGGVGAFCHEFGHALDYFAGMFTDPAPHSVKEDDFEYWICLSFANSNRTRPMQDLINKRTPRGLMEKLLNKIIWRSPGQHTSYYARVVRTAEEHELNKEYWTRRNELFARGFEVYVFNKMRKKGWFNTFLHHHKYEMAMYMTDAEFKPLERDFDAVINAIRPTIRPGAATVPKLITIIARIKAAWKKRSRKFELRKKKKKK
jgi:hypothetical protein